MSSSGTPNVSGFSGASFAAVAGGGPLGSILSNGYVAQALGSASGFNVLGGMLGKVGTTGMSFLNGLAGGGGSVLGNLGGLVGPGGIKAMNLVSGLGSLPGIGGGMSGFAGGANISSLLGAPGITFLNGLKTLLTSADGIQGLPFLSKAMSNGSSQQDVATQDYPFSSDVGGMAKVGQLGGDGLEALKLIEQLTKMQGLFKGPLSHSTAVSQMSFVLDGYRANSPDLTLRTVPLPENSHQFVDQLIGSLQLLGI